jgi:parallel beta-helix repeat protein
MKMKALIYLVSHVALYLYTVILISSSILLAAERPLSPHEQIIIRSNGDFTRPGTGKGCECVTGGSGTPADPYVIENWEIAEPNAFGIYVEGTDAYFIIRNVKIHGIEDPRLKAIFMKEVRNALKIEKSVIEKNHCTAIFLRDANKIEVVGNIIRDNQKLGIGLFGGSENVIKENKISNNEWGIRFDASNSNIMSDNSVIGHQVGMFLRGTNNTYKNNVIKDTVGIGVNLDTSKDSTFSGNTVCDGSRIGIALFSSDNIVLENNTVCDNKEGGIYLEISNNNVIKNNKITGDKDKAIVIGKSSHNNTVSGNEIVDKSNGKKAEKGKKDGSGS